MTYACCEHCKEDSVHDVDENEHDIPCNAWTPPDGKPCRVGSRRS